MWPQRPRRQLQETPDGVPRSDNIIITIIRRPLKPDPKHRALKQSGTANPRPQSVRDPAFLAGDFFDPHDLTQVKYEILRRVRSEGQSVTKASATFGVSRPTFYKVQADFDCNGLVGLLPAKRGPRQPHKITPEVARFIEEAVASGDDVDAARLTEHISERLGLVVHQRTVKRTLARLKKKRGNCRRAIPRWSWARGTVRGLARRSGRFGNALGRGMRIGTALRNGMAAWMRSVGEERVGDAAIPAASSAIRRFQGIEQTPVDGPSTWATRRFASATGGCRL
jgi:transposase